MSFNFKKYVRELLVEQTRVAGANIDAVDGSNYKQSPPGSGIFVSTTGKDPYSYSVVSSDNKKSVIKIISAPKRRQSAVNKTFKITTKNLDNPNVQLLYSSLLNLGKLTRLAGDSSNFKISNLTAEIMIVGQDFAYENFFKEQHDKIKRLGHENASSTLVYQRAGLQPANPQGNTMSTKLQAMISKIEDETNAQVVAVLIFPGSVRYMAKENPLKYVHDIFEIDRASDFVTKISEYVASNQPDQSGSPNQSDSHVQVAPNANIGRETMTQNNSVDHTKSTDPSEHNLSHDINGGIEGSLRADPDGAKHYFLQDGDGKNHYKLNANELNRYKIDGYAESVQMNTDGSVRSTSLVPQFVKIN